MSRHPKVEAVITAMEDLLVALRGLSEDALAAMDMTPEDHARAILTLEGAMAEAKEFPDE